MESEVYVIGSGPAAISCAFALVEQGVPVTILDAGVDLEEDRQRLVDTLVTQQPEQWDIASLQRLKEGAGASASGIPLKRVYGSDFPYRSVHDHIAFTAQQVTAFTSFARGGLSNVWGAAILPYRAEDIDAWPVSAAQLAPYYERVFRYLPLAATPDDLQNDFPLYSDRARPLQPSQQARVILDRAKRRMERLKQQGVTVGHSRLAVEVEPEADKLGCVYCGLCMYGCPHDVIYKSTHTLQSLLRTGKVRYIPDVVVDTVEEHGSLALIRGHERRTRKSVVFSAGRVFIGAGVIPTAHIMMRSLGAEGQSLVMRDSQYFLLPLLALFGVKRVSRERLHTLAQVFIELTGPEIGPRPAHLQVYTYNDLYARAMKSMLRGAYPLVAAPASLMLGRLMVIQGYLHSDLSSFATMTYRNGALTLRRQVNPAAQPAIRRIIRLLKRNRSALGFTPLTPLLNIGNPGQGSHVGGTFPMRRDPSGFETDVLGRPVGYTRTHLVDASVLPSIPATTITLNVMANAYRIGSEAVRDG